MVKNKAGKILLSGLLIIIISICLEESMLNMLIRSNGSGGLDKTVLTARLQLNSDKSGSFTLDDIAYLHEKLPGSSLSYLARQDGVVEGNYHTAQVKVLGTNFQWGRFRDLNMESGGMWTPEAEWEGQRTAVIGADLAAQLYGSQDVLGMDINILGKQFLIIGVFTPRTAMLERLTADGIPEVYIPGAAFYELVQNPVIRELQIESAEASNMDVCEPIPNILLGMGKDPAAFAITDYHPARVLMEQVPKIQIFIIGILVILLLLRVMKKNARHLVRILREDGREHYFSTVLKKRWREIGMFLAITAGLLLLILFIWSRIHFNLYIPSRYIPEDLIDISHFTEVMKQDISNEQKLAEYCQAGSAAQLEVSRVINRCVYYITWPLGLGLVLFAWPEIKKKVGKCNG